MDRRAEPVRYIREKARAQDSDQTGASSLDEAAWV
jgi:hypothetical protein